VTKIASVIVLRITNKELCESYREKPCVVCGTQNEVCGHHIRTKGSGGDDIEENLIPLCFQHHTEIHQIGLTRFCKKYSNAKWFILGMKWFYCDLRKRYFNDRVYTSN